MLIQRQVRVENEDGLHARPSALITRKAITYSGDVYIKRIFPKEDSNKRYNCKEIMGVMSVDATQGSVVELSITYEEHKNGMKQEAERLCSDLCDIISSPHDIIVERAIREL